MDERKGTEVARQLGLNTIGVFGILLEAKHRALMDRVLLTCPNALQARRCETLQHVTQNRSSERPFENSYLWSDFSYIFITNYDKSVKALEAS